MLKDGLDAAEVGSPQTSEIQQFLPPKSPTGERARSGVLTSDRAKTLLRQRRDPPLPLPQVPQPRQPTGTLGRRRREKAAPCDSRSLPRSRTRNPLDLTLVTSPHEPAAALPATPLPAGGKVFRPARNPGKGEGDRERYHSDLSPTTKETVKEIPKQTPVGEAKLSAGSKS